MSLPEILVTAVATVTAAGALISALAVFKDKPWVSKLMNRLVVSPAEEAVERISRRVTETIMAGDIAEIKRGLNTVVKELHPNSGTSLRDAVDDLTEASVRTEQKLNVVDERVAVVEERSARVAGQVDVLIRRDVR